MIFRQLFDGESSTYTYLLASRLGGEALIIDPSAGIDAEIKIQKYKISMRFSAKK